mgnify:CR=1 FL=1
MLKANIAQNLWNFLGDIYFISVFEGELTPAQYQKLDKELNEILTADDCVILFYSYNNKAIKKKVMGNSESSMQII